MKKSLTIILLVLIGGISNAQINFEKEYPSLSSLFNPHDIKQTTDGGYIIGAGSLIKTNNLGDTVWTKTHFSPGQYSQIGGVTQTSDGGYAYVLSTNTSGTWNATLVKTNSLGDITFSTNYGGALENYGTDIINTTDGGYLLSSVKWLGGTDPRIYIVKTDNLGNELWSYNHPVESQTFTNVLLEVVGNKYVVVGREGQDAVLTKLGSTGSVIWSKTYGTADYELGRGLSPSSSGGFIFTGWQYDIVNSSSSLYLVKTDVDGDTLWTRNEKTLYNQTFNMNEGYGFDTEELSNGNIMVTGSYGYVYPNQLGSNFFAFYSANGTVVNDTSYSCAGTNTGRAIASTSDGGYIISCGAYDGSTNFGSTLLIKLDGNLCVYPTDTIISLMNTGVTNTFCGGSGFVLQVPANNCTQVLWDNGATTDMISYNPPNNLPGSYSATFTNSYGCSSVSEIVLDTFLTVQPVINSTTGGNSYCEGDSLILFVSDEYVDYSPLASTWDNGNDTLIVYSAGTYYSTVEDVNGCILNSDAFIVIENPLPTPNISLQLNGDLVSSAVSGNQWYLDGLLISGATNQTFTPTSIGTYTVEVTDINGCIGMSAPYILNSLGVEQLMELHNYKYVNGQLTVIQGTWKLFDLTGRLVLSGGDGTHFIPVGVYILHIGNKSERIAYFE